MEAAPAEVQALFSNLGATAALLSYQTLEGVHRVADLVDGQSLPTFAREAQVGGRLRTVRPADPAGWQDLCHDACQQPRCCTQPQRRLHAPPRHSVLRPLRPRRATA